MLKMIKKGFVIFVIGVSILSSCGTKNRSEADISGIDLDLKINRLDKEIFEIDPGNIEPEIAGLIRTYGGFFELYSTRIINLGNPHDKNFANDLTGFITDYTMNKVHDKVLQVFPNMNSIENDLTNAFRRYKYFFPKKKIPALYSFIGGFNQSVVVADSILGIGVDKYLGKNCVFYDRLDIAKYMQQNMNPENIPTDAVKAWMLTEFLYNDSIDNLVNNMIYQGKIQYLLKALFPNTSDTLTMGFTAEQLNWCMNNEKQMWDYLIEKKILFTTDYLTINKHINPAPFTSGYPKESPGRASVWIGWQVVNAYMNHNSNCTLADLMFEDNYQKILTESHYEP